ncbi:iron chelate uptake ABC transporter family permease subunit [Brachybacterium sp. MASK1Z-5]|uniref:Iron chelate uptake ABC transporter family permease subunit n=1 Tax=Brachybacterium halotolerans TaxID=2795215 RepID=A0ABS1BAD5_9MICO|nr:iron chelate uptake ABC transporter family permease subunit [Brachybacterium halotolerans]MBK0331611.1 iron chelate uptake ABC transporter family permease subunit [Brachybacterium halotolerans]
MSPVHLTRPVAPPVDLGPGAPRRRRILLTAALCASLVLLCAVGLLSLVVGSGDISPSTVWSALVSPRGGIAESTVRDVRVPRTLIGVLVGAALSAAGALAQAVTRNPLADPGILGVNAGAGLAIALAVAFLHLTTIDGFIWCGFIGAFAAAVLVHAIAARAPSGPTPLRLTMVGVALGAVFMGMSRSLTLLSPRTFDQMRYWGAGSIADRPPGTLRVVLPFIAVGLVVALACGRSMNAMAMGEDVAVSLGVPIRTVRVVSVASITLLCGAATAAAGPISFVGLMVPHAVRFLTGPDQRWVIGFSLVLAPVLLLAADVLGRIVVMPAELQAGVMTAFLGAPVLVALVRRASRRSL